MSKKDEKEPTAAALDEETLKRALAQASPEQLDEAKNARIAADRPDPFPDKGPGRFRCVRRCYHTAGNQPGSSRLWNPGDILNAQDGEPVPRHFVRVDDGQGEEEAQKAIAENEKKEVPAFVEEGKKIDMGG